MLIENDSVPCNVKSSEYNTENKRQMTTSGDEHYKESEGEAGSSAMGWGREVSN